MGFKNEKYEKAFYSFVAKNVQVNYNHTKIADIMNGGNFGFKDKDRYGQIKYISDRETHKLSDKGSFSQLLSSINAKAKTEYRFAKNCKLLLPIAWALVIFNYLFFNGGNLKNEFVL